MICSMTKYQAYGGNSMATSTLIMPCASTIPASQQTTITNAAMCFTMSFMLLAHPDGLQFSLYQFSHFMVMRCFIQDLLVAFRVNHISSQRTFLPGPHPFLAFTALVHDDTTMDFNEVIPAASSFSWSLAFTRSAETPSGARTSKVAVMKKNFFP